MGEEGLGADARGIPQLPVEPGSLSEALKPLGSERRLRILQYLTRPHYLEEIASYLGVARQSAQRHVDQLLAAKIIKKQQGQRDSGPVMEYVVVPQRFFALAEDLLQLGQLQPEEDPDVVYRTERTQGPAASTHDGHGRALVVAHGIDPGTRFPLAYGDGPWTVGRTEDRDIQLEHDPFVSNKHAQLREREGELVLVDTYSTNGTYVNWNPLPPGDEHALSAGDVITIGKSRLVYWG